MNNQLDQKTDGFIFMEDSCWSRLITEINKSKPKFGNLTLELTYHENKLSRASILSKIDKIIFGNKDKNE
jgi:hypothetical protein